MAKAKFIIPTLLKGEKILQQNSTHVAIKTAKVIKIYTKGLHLDDLHYEPELYCQIELNEEDDLFAIFESLDETNRCNLAEANNEFKNYKL